MFFYAFNTIPVYFIRKSSGIVKFYRFNGFIHGSIGHTRYKHKNRCKIGGRALADNSRRLLQEKVWLHYFNTVLFEKGVITENERNKMALKIENKNNACINNK